MSTRSRRTFEQLVTLPDGAVPLAEAALLMACEEYPQLELTPYLDTLDEFAAVVRPRLQPRFSPLDTIETLNEVMFGVFGFRGNTENYNAIVFSTMSSSGESEFPSRCRRSISK
jgi:regulator of sirC expression with transglutaminase-like and TPR domain